MESYPVDIDPAQVIRWVKAERDVWPRAFRITAVRTREVREIPARQEFHLGDEEREDLSEVATVAAVEIAPGNAADGWVLRIVVEDEIGPRLSRAESARADGAVAAGDVAGYAMDRFMGEGDPDAGDDAAGSAATGQDPDAGQPLDLGAFYREFIRPGRGTATITAQADDAPARRRLARLLETIEKDGPHPAPATGPRRRRAGTAPPPVLRRG